MLFFIWLPQFTVSSTMHKDSLSSRPRQHLFLVFLIIAILTNVGCYLIVVLVCIFPDNDVEYLFLYLFSICMPSLEKCLYSRYLPILKIALFRFFAVRVVWAYTFLDISPLLDIWLAGIFSCWVGFAFSFVNGFLGCAEAFQLDVVPLVYICFVFTFSVRFKKIITTTDVIFYT